MIEAVISIGSRRGHATRPVRPSVIRLERHSVRQSDTKMDATSQESSPRRDPCTHNNWTCAQRSSVRLV